MSELSPPMYTHEKNIVQFSEAAVQNEVATNKAARAMFDRVLRIHIRSPGTKDEQVYEVEREYPEGFPNPVYGKVRKNDTIYKRLGKYIDEYKRDHQAQVVAGTPVDKWPMVDVRIAATLKHLGIPTVEALADMHDGNIGALGMGGRDLVRKAKDWLASAENAAAATELAAQKKNLEDRLAQMQEQIDAFGEAFEALADSQKAAVRDTLSKRGKRAKAA